jgi:hypothetical protein
MIIPGLITENELIALNSVTSPHGKYWLPIYWAFNLIKQARLSGNIESNRACEVLNEVGELKVVRTKLMKMKTQHSNTVCTYVFYKHHLE